MYDPPSQPPAGWYPDPHRPGTRRWWNGREWVAAWENAPGPAVGAAGGETADGSLPEIGHWLDASFRKALGRWRAASLVSLITVGLSTMMLVLSLRYLFDGVLITDDDVIGWDGDRLPLAIALVVVAALVGAIGQLALTVLMLRTIDGEDAAPTTAGELRLGGAALVETIRVLPRAIVWGLVIVAAAIISIVVLTGLGIVAPILLILAIPAWFLAVCYLAVRFAFISQSIVDRPGQPFTRSMDVSHGRFWSVVGRLLLMTVILWLISMALSIVNGIASGGFTSSFGQQFEIDENGNFGTYELSDAFATSPLALIVSLTVAVATAVLVTGVGAAALAILYRTVNPRDELTAR